MIQIQEININLYNFFETIKKHWKIVLFVTIISTIVSAGTMGIKFFSTLKLCEITMFIEPGTICAANRGKTPLDSAEGINERIKDKVYKWKLKEELIEPFRGVNLDFNASNPAETDLVKITSTQEKNSVTKGIEMMNDLFVKLVDDNKEKIEAKKKQLKTEVDDISAAIVMKQSMLELHKKNIEMFNKKEKKHNSRNKYNAVLFEKEKTMLADRNQTEKEIRDLTRQKDNAAFSESGIRNITLFSAPKAEKVSSNKKLWFYPIGGAVMGLVIGASAACILELRKKYKGKV